MYHYSNNNDQRFAGQSLVTECLPGINYSIKQGQVHPAASTPWVSATPGVATVNKLRTSNISISRYECRPIPIIMDVALQQ